MANSVRLEHVGSAAAVSGSHMMAWLEDDTLAYASHAMIHLATSSNTTPLHNGILESNLKRVKESLRTKAFEDAHGSSSSVVTAIAAIQTCHGNEQGLVAGFSDGSIHVWIHQKGVWEETRIISKQHAVTVVDAVWIRHELWIAWGSSKGAYLVRVFNPCESSTGEDMEMFALHESITSSIKSVYFLPIEGDDDSCPLLLLGTASPKNNQIIFVQNGIVVGSLAGHEDWVTGLAYQAPLLASASQDARIRLWKFTNNTIITDDEEETRLELVHGATRRTFISLDAILYGHEESVTSVCWHPQRPMLISSGLDRIILLWLEGEDGVWAPTSRVGSAGGILGGSIGSSLLGYNSAMIHRDGKSIIGHAYGGALHCWTWMEEPDHGRWQASPCVTGHFGQVTDLCWDTLNGDYLLTVGSDQTCRLWSPIPSNRCWVELARPQVHGYNLSAVACVSSSLHRHRIATGGEEKEIRVFDAPRTTLNMLQAVCGIHQDDREKENSRIERAFIPSLGLSNKASAADAAEEDAPSAGNYESPVDEMRLPVERDLGAVSLWPEVQKLFGHNTEIYTLSSSFESKLMPKFRKGMDGESPILASATKAREVEDAAIRIWDTNNGSCLQVLSGAHKSTVASLAFSPDSRFLASAGKDRKLVIWKLDDDSKSYSLACVKEAAHKRIIWSVQFNPSDPSILATGSRDGCVKLWSVSSEGSVEVVHSFPPQFSKLGKPDAVTSLSFAPVEESSTVILALGLESGRLEMIRLNLQTFDRTIVFVEPNLCHIAAITRMAWRPRVDNESTLYLATCSVDHSCRVFAVDCIKGQPQQ